MNDCSGQTKSNVLRVDTKIYSLEAIKRAAYRFAGRASIVLSPGPDTEINVVFTFSPDADPERVIADFGKELLDQDLREIIRRETMHVSNLILAHAFSRTNLAQEGEVS